jgi:hypothetical protein
LAPLDGTLLVRDQARFYQPKRTARDLPTYRSVVCLIHDNYSGLSTTTILAGAVPG